MGEEDAERLLDKGSDYEYNNPIRTYAWSRLRMRICMYLEKIKNTAPKIPELVMQAILGALDDGRIKLNEDLLPERELATALGVGRGSLRVGLAILDFLGVIASRGNRKVVIKNSDYIKSAISLLKLPEERVTMSTFMEFRRVNECAIAELACERATDADLAAVKEYLDRMEHDPGDSEADVEFHHALARASHNTIFGTTLRLINSMIYDVRHSFFERPHFHPIILTSHRAIFNAIIRREKEAAKEAMLEHLRTIEIYMENGGG